MTTARARASRRNGRKSRGPKTPAGKAVAARNARRHGLNLPVLADPRVAPDVDALARQITTSVVGRDDDPRCHELGRRVAAAQLDLVRVRTARLPFVATLDDDPTSAARMVPELLRLDRYERRALSRRKFAMRAFETVALPAAAARRHFGETNLGGKNE
jgi:hypothetical protein